METRTLHAEGHLIDSGILSSILNTILAKGIDYQIRRFTIGKNADEKSSLTIDIVGEDRASVDHVAAALTEFGVHALQVPSALLIPAPKDRTAPQQFHSTSNHRTWVFHEGNWHEVLHQRMDGAIIFDRVTQQFICRKLRDLVAGDLVVCTNDSVRIFPVEAEQRASDRPHHQFAFMTQEVSSERSSQHAVEQLADTMKHIRTHGGRTIVVCGPVVVHTGGSEALASLIRYSWIQGFLGGNAIAVHDIEHQLFGTSLGVNLKTSEVVEHGHSHHMRSINTINACGSIKEAVDQGVLTSGIMYEVIRSGIPYCLAGSIRDDGPLPETVMDMIEAQDQYAQIIEGADLILMLSTMLHAIGTANMTPSWVKMVCVDINPAVVTKLTDRGSAQTIGIVSDVGSFLRALSERLSE